MLLMGLSCCLTVSVLLLHVPSRRIDGLVYTVCRPRSVIVSHRYWTLIVVVESYECWLYLCVHILNCPGYSGAKERLQESLEESEAFIII